MSDRGYYLDLSAADVTTWLRHQVRWASLSPEDAATIEAACVLIDEGNF